MENLSFILSKLDQKEALFTIYETITKEIYDSDFNDMESVNLKRFSISDDINKIDEELSHYINMQYDCDLVNSALKNKCYRSELSEELQTIFDKSQDIFSVIKRIQTTEALIMERLMAHKLEIEKKIKESNNSPKISRYLNSVDASTKSGVIFGSRI